MKDTVQEGVIREWQEVRPNDSIAVIPVILEQTPQRILATMAFEAGRRFQVEHPDAKLGVPDYDAKQTFDAPRFYDPATKSDYGIKGGD